MNEYMQNLYCMTVNEECNIIDLKESIRNMYAQNIDFYLNEDTGLIIAACDRLELAAETYFFETTDMHETLYNPIFLKINGKYELKYTYQLMP